MKFHFLPQAINPLMPLFFCGLMIACNNKKEIATSSQLLFVNDSISILMDSIAKNVSSGGPIVWLRYFDNSPNFCMASDGQIAFPSFNAANEFIRKDLVKKIMTIELKWDKINIEPLSPNFASIGALFHEEIKFYSQKDVSINGYFTSIAKQTDFGWKLHSLHWSVAK